jgi:glutaredoxin
LFSDTLSAVELYKWTDKDGKIHYSDRQPPELKAEKLDIKIQSFTGPPVVTDWQEVLAAKPEKQQVTIYTTEWCGICKRAKAHMQKNKIAYKEFDIEKNATGQRDYNKLNGNGVPIILVGKQRMDGFSPERFDQLLSGNNR